MCERNIDQGIQINATAEAAAELKILMVGRSGNGKSSAVRSITNNCKPDRAIVVQECSGVGDTGDDRKEAIETVVDNVRYQISRLRDVAAIVFVLKYGVRFTKQEKDAVVDVKSMFGQDVFHKYGVILFTYGDLFEIDREDHGQTFMDWCKDQTGDINKLFEEVNYRIVLFDNKTNDASKQEKQFDALYEIVISMNVQYGTEQIPKSKTTRKKLVEEETISNGSPHDKKTEDIKKLLNQERSELYETVISPLLACFIVFIILIPFLIYIFR